MGLKGDLRGERRGERSITHSNKEILEEREEEWGPS